MSVAALSARTLARYVVPIALLSVLACAPLWFVGFRVRAPANPIQATIVVRTGYAVATAGLWAMLVLVAGVAPTVRAIANGAPPSQLRALLLGAGGLARGLVPALLAAAMVGVGGLALVVPGALLLVLVAFTGASTASGARARIEDSVVHVRRQLGRVAIVLAVVVGVAVVAIVWSQRGLVPIPKKLTPEQLAAYRPLVRATVIGATLLAPVLAVVLAAMHTRPPATASARG